MYKPYKKIRGFQTFVNRRWYGKGVVYSWISIKRNGVMQTLGDPWRCINPPIVEIERELFDVKTI
jgi:hypothetical protein